MRFHLQLLTDEEIERIHSASLRLISRVGMVLEDGALRSFLKSRAIPVDDSTGVVRFPQEVVEQALAVAPRHVSLWTHKGDELPLRSGLELPSTYANALSVLDYGSQVPRPSTRADLARFVRLGDVLEEIRIVCPVCWALDMPQASQGLHSAATTVSLTTKHTEAAPQNLAEARLWSDLVAIADRNLDPRPGPTLCFVASSTSPLQLDANTAQVLRYGVERKIPLILSPCPIAGASSPFTIAGTVMQSNAENLWLLTLAQLINEGSPVILGGAAGPMDMRSGRLSYGAPERHLMLVASIEMANFYGLPHNSPAGTVDSSAPDIQSGGAKMLTWVTRLLGGVSLGIGVGSLLTGSTVSLEQMVIDIDMLRAAQRFRRGFEVNEETIAEEAIARVGPGGDFLTDEHTLRWMRSGEYYLSPLANREGATGRVMLERAHERVEQLLASHESNVDPAVVSEIETYVREEENAARALAD